MHAYKLTLLSESINLKTVSVDRMGAVEGDGSCRRRQLINRAPDQPRPNLRGHCPLRLAIFFISWIFFYSIFFIHRQPRLLHIRQSHRSVQIEKLFTKVIIQMNSKLDYTTPNYI